MAATPRIPDAIKLPLGFGGAGDLYDRTARVAKVAMPMFGISGDARVYISNQGSFTLVTLSPEFQLYFPRTHARAGESRFDWADMGNGISYGYLKQDVADNSTVTLPTPPTA